MLAKLPATPPDAPELPCHPGGTADVADAAACACSTPRPHGADAIEDLIARATALRDAAGTPAAAEVAAALDDAQAAWEAASLDPTATLSAPGPAADLSGAPGAAAGLSPAQDRRRRAGLLRAHFLYRSGQLSASVDAGLDVLPLVRACGDRAERVDLLRQIAVCAVDTHRFDIALDCAEQAHREAQRLGDPGRLSLATNALGCFFERIGDPWQAERLLNEAVALARPQPAFRPLFAALNNLAAVLIGAYYLLRDAVPAAEARAPLHRARPVLDEALTQARTLGDRFTLAFVAGNLGEVLVHLDEADAARAILDEALAIAEAGGMGAQLPRIGCSLGELALLQGQPQQALERLQPLLAHPAVVDQPSTRLRLHHALWRCGRALGDDRLALTQLQAYMLLERQRSVVQLRTQSQLFVTRLEVEQARHETARESARAAQLEAVNRSDALTGLANRRALDERWPELLRHAEAGGQPLTLVVADLDHFKQINDRHGHPAGDAVLRNVAQLMQLATRTTDLVARVGGEEFVLVLPDTPPERAMEVCERLRRRVQRFDWSSIAPGLEVTLSQGLACTPPLSAEGLMQRADAALYRAKAGGRNRVELA